MYRRADLPVRGALALAVLRAAALLLVLALLLDLPSPVSGPRPSARWVLLDASLSMSTSIDASGESPWTRATRRAEELRREGWSVNRFGIPGSADTDGAPSGPRTLLAPALALAAEAGAREVVVLSDLRFEDPVAVLAELRVLPMQVRFEGLGQPAPNAGMLRLEVLDRPRPDEGGVAELDLHGGALGELLAVDVFEEGRVVASDTVPAPGPGLRRALTIDLPPSVESGLVRYTAVVRAQEDAFPSDDEAVAYARVGLGEEAGVALVSMRPGWEPRYLLPTLESVTGLPGSGFLRVGPDRFLPMGLAAGRGPTVDSATVRRVASEASLLVIHGVTADTEAWATELGRGARRVLAFPGEPAGAELLGLATDPPRGGEWYLAGEPPPSPIAGALAGVLTAERAAELPPLDRFMVPRDRTGLVAPLTARLGRTGPPESPIYLRSDGGGRTAFVLADGFWRWAARDDRREAYRTLWSGVAGWLLRDEGVAGTEIRPAGNVVPRGDPVRWRIPDDRTGYRITVAAGDSVVADTLFEAPGVQASRVLPPGSYAYAVSDSEGDQVGEGRFDVAATTAELLPLPTDTAALAATAASGAGPGRIAMPLRTMAWPYLSIIVLLCAEWIGRRRRGLR